MIPDGKVLLFTTCGTFISRWDGTGWVATRMNGTTQYFSESMVLGFEELVETAKKD